MLNKHTLTKFRCFAAFNIYSERITFGGFRGRRTDSVGGNCAGCNTHKVHKRTRSTIRAWSEGQGKKKQPKTEARLCLQVFLECTSR